MQTIKTTLRTYHFNTDNPAEREAYDALTAQLKAAGCRCFKTHGGKSHYHWWQDFDGAPVELETEWLFDDQWNTAPLGNEETGRRVFDWAEDALFDPSGRENLTIRRGHYLEQTEEMRAARASRVSCGYCGKQYHKDEGQRFPGFCIACIDSPYLKAEDLLLLRLRPVTRRIGDPSPELTEAERAPLLSLYREAQAGAGTERARKRLEHRRAAIVKEAEKEIANAQIERKARLWLLDRGLLAFEENCIYYKHTGRFCFGWRTKLDHEQTSALLDVISEFPGAYDIESATRGRLSSAEEAA